MGHVIKVKLPPSQSSLAKAGAKVDMKLAQVTEYSLFAWERVGVKTSFKVC